MELSLAGQLDALAVWRRGLDRQAAELSRFLLDHELLDDGSETRLATLRERLASDRLCVAFVAEFSRGKSELINAIFFADTGRRILPATPGRTTMCPVELGYEPNTPALLALLPIDTRLEARVYGRAGLPCTICGTTVRRTVQAQRSTFFCPACQRR